MNKIWLIIKREYLTRVKKKSFILLTILGPILMAAVMIVPAWIALKDKDFQIVEVVDETGVLGRELKSTTDVGFNHNYDNLPDARENLYKENYTSILYIPRNFIHSEVQVYYRKQPGVSTIQFLKSSVKGLIEDDYLLQKCGITRSDLKNEVPGINITTHKQNENGSIEQTSNTGSMIIGIGAALLIYMFIFIYGVQVMRGVIEEKTSRIVEIIISSVKPFQLMMGKIVGIAMVGLTQFLLWIILSTIFIQIGGVAIASKQQTNVAVQMEEFMPDQTQTTKGKSADVEKEIMTLFKENLGHINFVHILLCFLFFFLGGYLLYSALLAAIGSAVDSEADTQQFMMPITAPLIFAFVMAQFVINNPDGGWATFLSLFPLTSPVIMMVRLPYGVPMWELLTSMALLVLGFIAATWLAGKIYRTGILMYGKKISYKEIWKWIKYRN